MLKLNKPLFLFFLLSFFLTVFVVNIKSYLLLFVLFFCSLFFYFKKNIWTTILLTFFFSIPFENAIREWIFQITTPLFFNIPTSGYQLYFGISVKLILAITLFFLIIFSSKKKLKNQINNFETWLLIVFLFIACFNTLFYMGITPILGLIRIWLGVWIFILSKKYFLKNKTIFFTIIISLFIFSTIIGFFQLINQKPIGRFIELTPSFNPESGYLTTDGIKQYRVSGFISHPVYFASFISILLPIFIGFFLQKINNKTSVQKIIFFILLIILGSLVIIGTLSRSSFLTLFLTLLLFSPFIYQKLIKNLIKNKKVKTILIILSILCFVGLTLFLSPRIKSFKLLFENTGNASTRLELIKQSLKIIIQNPFGVGLNNFTTALIKLNLPNNLLGFIVPVHNTFLIFFTELGIPAGILFTIFIFRLFFKNFKKTRKNLADFGVWIGILTFLINSQIHPLFNLDPTFDLLMFILGYYSICLQSKN